MTLNRPIFLNTLRSHLDAPVRLIIAGILLLIFYGITGNGLSINGAPMMGVGLLVGGGNWLLTAMLWLLGLGLISRDISGGSIQLVLLRPLSRPTYVLSKWAALASLGWAALIFIHGAFLARQGMEGISAGSLALLFAAQCAQVAAVAAVIALFSTVPMNYGELGLLILCLLGYAGLKLANLKAQVPGLDSVLGWAWRCFLPSVAYSPSFADSGHGDLLLSLALNAAVTVAALAGAFALLARREFSYAESGS